MPSRTMKSHLPRVCLRLPRDRKKSTNVPIHLAVAAATTMAIIQKIAPPESSSDRFLLNQHKAEKHICFLTSPGRVAISGWRAHDDHHGVTASSATSTYFTTSGDELQHVRTG
jgi:hypothetical protein